MKKERRDRRKDGREERALDALLDLVVLPFIEGKERSRA